MAKPTSGAVLVARGEPRTCTSLLLESIALRHQIAVPGTAELVALTSVCFDRLFGSCYRAGVRIGARVVVIFEPETVLRWRGNASVPDGSRRATIRAFGGRYSDTKSAPSSLGVAMVVASSASSSRVGTE